MTRFLLPALVLRSTFTLAFKDTSPFFLLSTSPSTFPYPNDVPPPTLLTSKSLLADITPELSECRSDVYIVVSQPGVNAVDFHSQTATPHLRRLVLGAEGDKKELESSIRSRLAVQDVKGTLSAYDINAILQRACDAEHVKVDATTGSFPITDEPRPRVMNLEFPALPTGNGRGAKMAEHDALLASVLDLLPSSKYTILYTTTPSNTAPHPSINHAESESYEIESLFHSHTHSQHMDLKRDVSGSQKRQDAGSSSGNVTLVDGPLFERYQFLSPGLFMGLLITFILISTLYVAVSGVSSLQITYAAFDKEMGPMAHKKPQ